MQLCLRLLCLQCSFLCEPGGKRGGEGRGERGESEGEGRGGKRGERGKEGGGERTYACTCSYTCTVHEYFLRVFEYRRKYSRPLVLSSSKCFRTREKFSEYHLLVSFSHYRHTFSLTVKSTMYMHTCIARADKRRGGGGGGKSV